MRRRAASTRSTSRDRALIRSIVTASLRRLGTIRAALARFLEQRTAARRPASLEHALIVGAAQIALPRRARPCGGRPRRARRARRPEGRALRRARQRRAAQHRPRAATNCAIPPTRSSTRRPGWPRGGRRTGATRPRPPSRSCTGASRRSTSPCAAMRPHGRNDWAESCCRQAPCVWSIATPCRTCPDIRKAQWWVQDAAAAIPARLLRVASGERVADLCAAPGGKTAQLAAAGAEVVALDRSAERMKRLAENFERLRLPVEIAVSDGLTFDAPPFDAILLDAPCTATGTIRRHPDVAWVKTNQRHRFARGHAGEDARSRLRAVETGRAARLLHLLAGARGRRSADRGAPAPQSRYGARSDRGPTKSAASPSASPPKATCARCQASCPTRIRALRASTDSSPAAWCARAADGALRGRAIVDFEKGSESPTYSPWRGMRRRRHGGLRIDRAHRR